MIHLSTLGPAPGLPSLSAPIRAGARPSSPRHHPQTNCPRSSSPSRFGTAPRRAVAPSEITRPLTHLSRLPHASRAAPNAAHRHSPSPLAAAPSLARLRSLPCRGAWCPSPRRGDPSSKGRRTVVPHDRQPPHAGLPRVVPQMTTLGGRALTSPVRAAPRPPGLAAWAAGVRVRPCARPPFRLSARSSRAAPRDFSDLFIRSATRTDDVVSPGRQVGHVRTTSDAAQPRRSQGLRHRSSAPSARRAEPTAVRENRRGKVAAGATSRRRSRQKANLSAGLAIPSSHSFRLNRSVTGMAAPRVASDSTAEDTQR